MRFHKIHRRTEQPRRADKSAGIRINLRRSSSPSVGASGVWLGGVGLYDSVGKFCTDKRTRRTKDVLEEYERHEKQFENPFLLDEDADSCLSCFFRSFCSI